MRRNLYDRLDRKLKDYFNFNIENTPLHQVITTGLMNNHSDLVDPIKNVHYCSYIIRVSEEVLEGGKVFATK